MASPVIDTRTSLLIAEEGKAFSFTPAATGSPTLWEALNLPSGLSINSSTGVISGTPTVAGVFGTTLKATNYVTRSFTVDAGTDVFTSNGHPFVDGDLVLVSSTTTLPSPLVASTLYEVRDSTTSTFKLSSTAGGAALDITDTGTGTHSVLLPQTDELSIIIPILQTTSRLTSGDIAIEIDVDIVTGRVTVLGMEDYSQGLPLAVPPATTYTPPVLSVKSNDRFPILIGFTRNGILQELDISSIVFGSREVFGDPVVQLSEGAFVQVGTGSSTRYRGILHAEKARIDAILSSGEEDAGAQVDVSAEISYGVTAPTPAEVDETKSRVILLEGGHNGGSEYTGTITIGNVPVFDDSIGFSLVVGLDVTARASQDCDITRAFDLTWNSTLGVFEISNASGATSDAGASDGDNWIVSSLSLGTITGTSDGISVPYTIETSDDANIPYAKFEAIGASFGGYTSDETDVNFGTPNTVELYNGDTLIGSWTLDGTYANEATFAADFESDWETATGIADVQSVSLDYPGGGVINLTVEVTPSSEVTKILFSDYSYEVYVQPASIEGTARSSTLSMNLVQVDPWPTTTYRRTSDTISLRMMDEINTES